MKDARESRVTLYARVSQVRDERNLSVDDQLAELRQWAAREGWSILGEYRDDDVSASRYAAGKKRPGWESALAEVRSEHPYALLVWELSRSTRDIAVYAELEESCRANHVRLGYKGRTYDLNASDDGFTVGLDAVLAARESAVTSERVQRASDARAARGAPNGSVTYGYRRVIDPASGRVIGRDIDPERGPVVQEIARRVLAGEAIHAITVDLNRRGITTTKGKPWLPANVAKLVRRPAYAGLRVRRGEVLEGVKATWPPLISLEDHYALVAMFADPERDKFRNPTHVKHLGAGIFRCGVCGGRMRAHQVRVRPVYGCRDCYRVSRGMADVDHIVEEVIIRRLARPDALEVLAGPADADDRAAARAEVSRLRAEMSEARKALKAGRLSPLDMADYREGWEPRIAAAEREAHPPALSDAIATLAGPDARERWESASVTTKRTALDLLMAVTILPAGRGSTTFNPETVKIEWRQ